MMPSAVAVPDVVALDIETTGLHPHLGDRICEVALLKIRQGEVSRKLVTLVNPERGISFSARLINGISDEMVAQAPTFREIGGTVLSFLRDETLLIHNAGFDLSFLKLQARACGLEFPETRVVDTLRLARKHFKFESNSLGDLAVRFGVGQQSAHRAESDALTTYRIFCHLYEALAANRVPPEHIFRSTSEFDARAVELENLPPLIARALRTKETISIRYSNRDGEVSDREIRPIELINENSIWYLVGFCFRTGEQRVFRMDRIAKVVEQFE